MRSLQAWAVRGLLVVSTASAMVESAAAQNCPAANPFDSAPDTVAIQACFDAGTDVILQAGSPGYIIDDKIRFRADDKLLTSVGGKARLLADPNLVGPILQVQDANNYEISEIIFDGNRQNRTQKSLCTGSFAGQYGSNFFVSGSGWKVHHVDTINAMCGSGMEVAGDSFEIYSVYSASNGDEAPGGPWADGMTLNRCDGGYIHDNGLVDNTDVGMFVFSGINCVIEHNMVTQSSRFAFTAVGLGDDHNNSSLAGLRFWSNTIDVGLDKATFGLNVGPHVSNPSVSVSDVGSVKYNSISGAVVNLAVDGIQAGDVSSNTLSNPRGSRGSPCSGAQNYTAGHYGGASLGSGFVCIIQHSPCTCAP